MSNVVCVQAYTRFPTRMIYRHVGHTSGWVVCVTFYVLVYRGNYGGPEAPRLATLKYAAMKGAPYVDVEYKAANLFFASKCCIA